MNILKPLTILIVLLSSTWSQLTALTLPDEDLSYKVMYKWGLINKQAGRATLSLRNDGTNYNASLVARTEPWADHFYSVRDTLLSTMQVDGLIATHYEKIAHEDGNYSLDVVEYSRIGDIVTGYATRKRQKKDKPPTIATTTITATGATFDMLSVFYYLRTLDFYSMQQGEELTVNIFSGKKSELLRIKYFGRTTIEIDDRDWATHRVSFYFTTDGKKKSSDDMDCWISADNRRIPIRLEGKLPIGKVRCFYTGD